MSQPVRATPRAVEAVLALGALLGSLLVAYATAVWGPGVFQLALHSFTAAEGLRHGTAMEMSRGGPFTIWPPLLPALHALGRSLGLEYTTAGLAINLISHAATLYLSSKLLLRLFGSVWMAVACMAVMLASPELFLVDETLQTEPPFFALVLGCTYAFVLYLERPTRTRLSIVTALASLACLQRYMGVALVLSTFLLMLRYPEGLTLGRRLVRAVAFSAIALLPLVLWMARSRSVEGSWGVMEVPPTIGPAGSVAGEALTLALIFTRGTTMDATRGVLNLTLALALGLLALVRLARERSSEDRRALIVFLAFPPVYLATLIVIASSMNMDRIAARFLLPVVPFLWGAIFLGFQEVNRRLAAVPAWIAHATRAAILALFAAHMVSAAIDTRGMIVAARKEGVGGLSTPEWGRSSLLAWLRANRLEGQVYSNMPELLIFAAGRRATYADAASLPTLVERGPVGAYVVWTDRQMSPVPVPDLSGRGRRLAWVARLDDGGVYRVETGP